MFSYRNAIVASALALVLGGCSAASTTPPPPAPQTLYVGTCGSTISVTEYPAATANGNVAPTVTIIGAATLMACPEGITFDSAGTMYVADCGNSVIEFSAGASGNATPVRHITGLGCPVGVAIEPSTGNLFVGDFNLKEILVFAPGANGAAVPLRTIDVTAGGLGHADSLGFDPAGNVWVSDESNPGNIAAYAPGASGAAVPVFHITGASTNLEGTLGMTLDPTGKIYAVNFDLNNITVFPAGSTGNIAPTLTVVGAATTLKTNYGIALDRNGNEYNTNCGGGASDIVTIFPISANGNMAPARTIGGALTGLSCSWGIAVR